MNRRTKVLSRLIQIFANGYCETIRPYSAFNDPPIPRGTLVVASSCGFLFGDHCRFNVAAYVRPLYDDSGSVRSGARVMDLFSSDVCDFGNESFVQVVFKYSRWREYVLGDVVDDLAGRLEEAATR